MGVVRGSIPRESSFLPPFGSVVVVKVVFFYQIQPAQSPTDRSGQLTDSFYHPYAVILVLLRLVFDCVVSVRIHCLEYHMGQCSATLQFSELKLELKIVSAWSRVDDESAVTEQVQAILSRTLIAGASTPSSCHRC